MKHHISQARHATSRWTRVAVAIATVVALGVVTSGGVVGAAASPHRLVVTGRPSCSSVRGSTTLKPGLTSASDTIAGSGTYDLDQCSIAGSTNLPSGTTVSGVAVVHFSVQDWSCSSLLGDFTAPTTVTVNWSSSSSSTKLAPTTLSGTDLEVTTDAAGRVELSWSGFAGTGSFTGSTAGSASALSVSLQALAASVSSGCSTTPTNSFLVTAGTGVFGGYTAATTTLESGEPGNVNSSNLDTATSLCVEPGAGATAPTGNPLVWPSTVASSNCLKGSPSHPYLETSPWSTTLAGARWVGTDPTGQGQDNDWTGSGNDLYDYDVDFTVPTCTVDTISVTAYADNGVGGYLDGNFVAGQAGDTTSASFTTSPLVFPAGVTAGAGAHVIDFLVDDTSQFYTGILYSVTLTSKSVCGTLTICKVAGNGVALNTPHIFHVTVGSHSFTVTVNAGPGPTGYCDAIASYLTPQTVAITEVIPANEQVTSIVNSPAVGTTNLAAGTDDFTLTTTTTTTYTDAVTPGALSITKSATPTAYSSVGTVLTFTFVVTNTGGTPLSSVYVSDPLPGLSAISCAPNPNPIPTLAPHASVTCTATYTVTQADLDAGSVANTVSAVSKGPLGEISANATATVPAVQVPGIQLDKTGTPGVITAVGQVITYLFAVTNTGNVTLTNVLVADPLVGLSAITCTPYSNPIPSLAPGQSVTCTATYSVTAVDLQLGGVSNTATATGTSPTDTQVSSNGVWTVPTLGQAFTCESPSPADFLSETGTFFPDTQLYGTQYPLGAYYPLGPLYAPSSFPTYNALAFDPKNDFLYATRMNTTSLELMKIDSSGNVVWTKSVTGFTGIASGPTVGAFDGAGNYWITKGSGYPTAWEINVTAAVPTVITHWNFVGSASATDWEPADWALYGPITNTNTKYLFGASGKWIYRVDLTTHQVTAALAPGLMATVGNANKTFGADWTFSNGDLGFSNNATGDIFEVSSSNPFAATPTWTLVGHSAGPNSTTDINDGAACIGTPVDLSITKTGPATVTGSGTITWVLTVTNHGPGNSSGYVVNDAIPAAVTNPMTSTFGCSITGHALQCVEGTLVNGNSFNIIVTATAPATDDTCITNTASVIGDEGDPVSSNNTSSVQTCTTSGIVVTKTANVTGYTTAGQPIVFRFKVTNTATPAGDTNFDPGALSDITVSDSLVGVSAVVCPGTDSDVISSLASGTSATCTATYVTTTKDLTHGTISDVATATAYNVAGHLEKATSNKVVLTAQLNIATTTLAAGVVGVAYKATLSATGGTAPYTWAYVGTPAIEKQLKLSAKGELAGTFTKGGAYTFTVKVTDKASKGEKATSVDATFTLTVT
jgi:uncharacterized repeat protein (TIGR01451 family)